MARRRTGSDQSPDGADCVFRREGEYWTIAYQGELLRLRDVEGLRYIARLLGRPGEKLPAHEIQKAP